MDSNKINEKLDIIIDKQSEMNVILAVQAEQLRIHIARTDALEALAQDYREEADEQRESMIAKLRPIEDHVTMLRGAGKVFAILGSVLALALAALKIFFD